MGKRRMLSTDIICSRRFTQMPQEAQLLYMHLNSAADDDGFLQNAEWVCRGLGAEEASLSVLEKEGYTLSFPSGVTVLLHWNVNNQIRKDRYQPTYYMDEKSQLMVDERGVYQLIEEKAETEDEAVPYESEPEENMEEAEEIAEPTEETEETEEANEEAVPDWVQDIDEAIAAHTASDSKGADNPAADGSATDSQAEQRGSIAKNEADKTAKKAYGIYENVFLTDGEFERLKKEYPDYLSMIENLSVKIRMRGYEYQDHFVVLVKWAKEDAGKKTVGASVSALPATNPPKSEDTAKKQKYDFEAIRKKALENVIGEQNAG